MYHTWHGLVLHTAVQMVVVKLIVLIMGLLHGSSS